MLMFINENDDRERILILLVCKFLERVFIEMDFVGFYLYKFFWYFFFFYKLCIFYCGSVSIFKIE